MPKTSISNPNEKYYRALDIQGFGRGSRQTTTEDFLKPCSSAGSSNELFLKGNSLKDELKSHLDLSSDQLTTARARNQDAYHFQNSTPIQEVEMMSSSEEDEDNDDDNNNTYYNHTKENNDDDDGKVENEPLIQGPDKEPLTIPFIQLKKKDEFLSLSALSARFRKISHDTDFEEPSMDGLLCISAATEQYLKTAIIGAFLQGRHRRLALNDLKQKLASKNRLRAKYTSIIDEKFVSANVKDFDYLLKSESKNEYLFQKTNQTALIASRKPHLHEKQIKELEKTANLITKEDVILFLKNSKARDCLF